MLRAEGVDPLAMTIGTVYLVPNLLGIAPPPDVLPARTIEIARGLRHWVVETPKPARAFLKSLAPSHAISELDIQPLPADADAAALGKLLAPAREGHDIGLLSGRGCPGVADPGATLVAAAHAAAIRVVPLVGPSSLLLALMASGMNGQRLSRSHVICPYPQTSAPRPLRRLEEESRALSRTQLFIETPYRNAAMIQTLGEVSAARDPGVRREWT
jgi:16S rRNA (cytidine1402-2'-O)-methyltransferase